ncbi:helix-turn-helix domain-containing protein [Spirosoma sordidisoli]|uniref:AraC family transcriptional regulator n=1 Tax=Spirosoma sordidisoli TaxID=2502893 RepID=A0A4V1RWH7_9BACT|nr:AraC family transcriptional regulator [Spirosoma sordidisoli]RYC70308.1 AraC family transcriptional regulator [Spirosoma sordidisoli]
MTFYFSAYSTPLLFGFVQGWVYAILLWIRGRREERLSDILLGWVLVGCSLNIWEYMLGFGGIEVLWRELEFFPRTLGYLFPVLCYFYLKSQVNAEFRFSRRDLWHAVPFLVFVVYHVSVFAMGPAFVSEWEKTVHYPYHLDTAEFVIGIGIDILYLYWALQLYRQYHSWIRNQFSEIDTISFRWFRNFMIAMAVTSLFNLVMTLISLAFNLNFWQDWWDELAGVALIYYVSIEGYAQVQVARRLRFHNETVPVQTPDAVLLPANAMPVAVSTTDSAAPDTDEDRNATLLPPDLSDRLTKLLDYMAAEKPYLDPDLSLADLARRLHTNPVILSQVINTGTGKNFNDFINEYRVDEFKRQVRDPATTHLSFLGLALNCGFNSKATFNRAFRKFTGTSPGEFLNELKKVA